MKIGTFASVLTLALLATAAPAQDASEPSFSPEAMRAHVAFLSDDLLEGRNPGERGYDIAAKYVATRFEALGLKPAGKDGWLQPVSFREAAVQPGGKVTIGGQVFEGGKTVYLGPSMREENQAIEAPVVFVGYGLDMPEKGLNDYAGLDVKGKYVAILAGFPKGMPSDLGAHLNAEKGKMAQKHGAIGTIAVRTRQSDKAVPFERMLMFGDKPSLSWMQEDGTPYSSAPDLRASASLSNAGGEKLFEGAPRALKAVLDEADKQGGKPKGFALKQKVKIERTSSHRQLSSPNVVAMLPGSDPALAGEYVVLMAHLDHEGISPNREGDKINNGAMDNASGIATMLEVARAMSEAPVKPKRSILFAAVTAEEEGLLGSQYLARHPVVAGAKPVAVVNLDMPILLYDFTDLVAFGAEHSTLGPVVAKASESVGVKLSPDPIPEQGVFTRSDHYNFVREGVPSVFLMTGFANGGGKLFQDFLANHYHQPSDQMTLPFNWDAAAKFAKINYAIANAIANEPVAPRWYTDSFFGNTFAAGQEKANRSGK